MDFPDSPVVKNLPWMQGTWVQSLAWEDPTCLGATKPVCHNSRARTLQLWKPTDLEPVLHSNEKPKNHNEECPHSLQLEKAQAQQQRPTTVK